MMKPNPTTQQLADVAWRKSWWREYLRLRIAVDKLPPEVTQHRVALQRVDHILHLGYKRGDRSFTRVETGKRLRPAMQAVFDALYQAL